MTSEYLESVTKQFEYYKMLGEKTFSQLTDEQLFWHYNEDSNSIAIIVKHLWGNMLSRLTELLKTYYQVYRRVTKESFENALPRLGICSIDSFRNGKGSQSGR